MRNFYDIFYETESLACADIRRVDKEFHSLSNILEDNETIGAMISCFHVNSRALLVCSNQRLLVVCGNDFTVFNYELIKNVKLKSGWIFSKLTVSYSLNDLIFDNLDKKLSNIFYNVFQQILTAHRNNATDFLQSMCVSSPIAKFDTKVVGVTYDCSLSRYSNRQDILECLSGNFNEWNKIYLNPYEYNYEPAIYVMYDKRDLGHVNKKLAISIINKYPPKDYVYKSFLTDIIGGPSMTSPKRKYGCVITIRIYAK